MNLTLSLLGSVSFEGSNLTTVAAVQGESYVDFDTFGPRIQVELTGLNRIAANPGDASISLRHSLVENDAAGTLITKLTPSGAGTAGVQVGNSATVIFANPGGKRYVTFVAVGATGPIPVYFRGLLATFAGPDADICSVATTPLIRLRNGAKVLADKVDDASVTDATWDEWVNDGMESLWSKVSTMFADHFHEHVDFALVGGTEALSFYDVSTIPAVNFRRVRYVQRDPGTEMRRRVGGLNFNMKDQGAGARASALWDTQRAQKLMGQRLIIEPYELAGGNYRLYYVPKLAKLVGICDALDPAIDQWAEYIKVFAAMKALGVEESDLGPLALRMQAFNKEFEEAAAQRDDGQADRIADVEGDGDDWRPW